MIERDGEEMPMGLAFQMALNKKALENFAGLSEAEKRQVLEAARSTTSKAQMRSIVNDLMNLK